MHNWKHVHDGSVLVWSISHGTLLGRGSTGWDSRRSVAWGCGWNTLCRGSPGWRLFSQLGAEPENAWKLEEIFGDPTIVSSRFVCMRVFSDCIPSFSSPWWPSNFAVIVLMIFFYLLPSPPHGFKHVQAFLLHLVISCHVCHHPWYE